MRWLLQRKPWLQLLIEFTQVRLAVEPSAAALAAEVAGPAEKAVVQQALERMIAAERGDDDPLTSDIAFHVAILAASGNKFFGQLRDFIDTALRFSIRITNRRKGVRLASVADHKKIADAIMAGKPRVSGGLAPCAGAHPGSAGADCRGKWTVRKKAAANAAVSHASN